MIQTVLQEGLCKPDSGIVKVEAVCMQVSKRLVSAEEFDKKACIDPTVVSIGLLWDIPIRGSWNEWKMRTEELLNKLLFRLVKAMEETKGVNVLSSEGNRGMLAIGVGKFHC